MTRTKAVPQPTHPDGPIPPETHKRKIPYSRSLSKASPHAMGSPVGLFYGGTVSLRGKRGKH